ncbi:MAG TPA: hypothetical protein VGM79_31055, partial [Streptosporangiaceae bacterium]
MAAVACAVGRWTTAVGPVLLLAPSACPSLARTLEEQWKRAARRIRIRRAGEPLRNWPERELAAGLTRV